jgi:hypothetical protein
MASSAYHFWADHFFIDHPLDGLRFVSGLRFSDATHAIEKQPPVFALPHAAA